MQTTSAITWASSEQQMDPTVDTVANAEQQKLNPDYLVQRKFFIQSMQGDITERYDHEARIGEGGFGVVYRVRDKIDGKSTLKVHQAVSSCREPLRSESDSQGEGE